MLLENKVIIVTGASRGIGRAIAVEAARHGADVLLNYWGSNDASYGRASAVEDVVAEIHGLGRRAVAVDADVADQASGDRLVDAAVKSFGKVDVLAANAGICSFHSFLDLPPELLRRTVEVNLNGAFYVTQAVARRMRAQGRGGAIIATSSISALVGGAQQTHYTPTKAGVLSLMQSCAIALGPFGIRCNAVLPGTIATDLNKEDLSSPEKLRYMEGRIPLGRLGRPEDVANAVIMLASDLAGYVTGAALLVDGGLFVNLQ
jgi:L-rhamnose 1-dehydrogenase